MKKVFLCLTSIVFFLPVTGFGAFIGNPMIQSYDSKSTGFQNLNTLIAKGASYFLKSNADYLLLTQRYEQNPADVAGLQEVLSNTIENLKGAAAIYNDINTLTLQVPYNPSVISQLVAFDYTGFQKEKGLVGDILLKVKSFLVKGDVNGSWIEMSNRMNQLLNLLYLVKLDLDKGITPDVFKLWDINHKYMELMLFGQYESQILKITK
ncbi:MAG: hypothetical protein ACM3SY_11430 [Candidatus Omnitrophota bacterium]